MNEITMTNGNITITFCCFSNGNAVIVNGANFKVIEDVAKYYIMMKENGFEEVKNV